MPSKPTITEQWCLVVERVGVQGREFEMIGPYYLMKKTHHDFYTLRKSVAEGKTDAPTDWLNAANNIRLELRPNTPENRDTPSILRFIPYEDSDVNRVLQKHLDLAKLKDGADEEGSGTTPRRRRRAATPLPADEEDETLEETPFTWEPPTKIKQ
jgi:hypothetical protein